MSKNIKNLAALLDEELAKEVLSMEPRKDDEVTVQDMIRATGLSQKSASDKLNARVRAGTMTRRRLGREFLYRKA